MAPEEKVEANKQEQKTSSEPLTGSSKRKRKSTIIKRNVTNESVEDVNEAGTKSKSVKCSIQNKKKNVSEEKVESRKSKRLINRKNKEEDQDSEKQEVVKETTNSEEKKEILVEEEEGEKEEKSKQKFFCDFCKKFEVIVGLPSKEKLEKHISKFHKVIKDEEQKFGCNHCVKPIWFSSKKRLSYHVNSKHPGVLEFVCEVCTKSFKLKANYKLHLSSHNVTPKKIFKCEGCDGSFVNKAGFESHKKRFPGPHFKKVCDHCGFSFSKESHLRNHRCKKLLVEQAEKDRLALQAAASQAKINAERKDVIIEPMVTNDEHYPQHVVLQTQDEQQVYYRPIIEEQEVLLHEFQDGGDKNEIITTNDQQTIVIEDVDVGNGQIIQAVRISDLDSQTSDNQQQVFHVNVADWNVVAPYVIKEN